MTNDKQSSGLGRTTTYEEAAEMLRHYSSIRAAVISFLIPAVLGAGALAISAPKNSAQFIYLMAVMFGLYALTLFLSMHFSANVHRMRQILIMLESGQDLNLFNTMDHIPLMKCVWTDAFDVIQIISGILLFVGMVSYCFSG